MSDVVVLGLMAPTHVLVDIQRDVPHLQTVTIPAELAARSKDLWRAISARQIFHIKAGPHTPRPSATANVEPDLQEVLERNRQLELDNAVLRNHLSEQDAQYRLDLAAQQLKLDTILGLLQRGAPMLAVPHVPTDSVVPGISDVPTYIPSSITPDIETRIDIKREETGATLSGASDKLRELRKRR